MTTQTLQAPERVERIEERVSRLEGSYGQVSERLGDLVHSVDRVRAELAAQSAAQTAATEALRAEMNANHAEQRTAMAAQSAAQTAATEGLRAEMNSRFNVLIAVVITALVAQFSAIIGGTIAILTRL